MNKLNKKYKFLIIMLISLILANSLAPIVIAASCIIGADIKLTGYGSVASHVRNSESGDYAISTHLVGYYGEDGVFYPAYCLNRDRDGADNSYVHNVNVYEILQNDELYNKIWRVATAGYPYHSAEELGVDDWTYAYQATKTAIYDILGQTDVNNYYGVDDTGRRTVDLMRRLVAEGENGTRTYQTPASSINKSGNIFLDGNYYVQNYTVTSNVELSSFDILITGFPSGTITTNSSGTQKTQFNPGEIVQVRIPKGSVESGDIDGKIVVNANTKSYPIFYGKTYDNNLQNYAITADPIVLSSSRASLSLSGNTGSIKIKKVDVDTGAVIPNTTFELSKIDGTIIGTSKTDGNGYATFSNLYQGTYNLKEISSNANYVLNSEVIKVNAEYNKTNEFQVTNEKRKGQVKVIKVDADNNEIKLEGVKFNVKNSKGTIVDELTTNSNGEAVSKRLPIDETYTIQEIKTLQNYVLNSETKTVTLTENQITDIKFTNEKKKGQIRVIKVDEDYNEIKIPDVKFNVLDSKGNVVDELITNSNGEAVSKRLPIDENYTIKEISTSQNYILNNTTTTVTLQENQITNVTFTNKHKEGNLKVYKVDKDNNRITLGNVEFDLYSNEFSKVIGSYTTDVNGEISVNNLRIGNYKLIEKNTNRWYNLNDEETIVTIEYEKTTDTMVENELKKGSIKIIKVDLDNNEIKLEGVKFEILDSNGNVLETIITNQEGEAITGNYPVRDYESLTIRETETLKDYVLNSNPETIELTANEITTIKFENEVKKGQIKVIKIDKDNAEVKLQGVKFNILDENETIVDTIITDENGEAITKRLPITHNYTVQEVETNKNYVLNDEEIKVTLEEDEIKTLTFENEKKKGQIQVIKIDKENAEVYIPDTTFEVYSSNGELVDTITTDSEGKAITKRLPIDDEYLVKETISNKFYVLSEETQTIELKEDEITDAIFENEKKKGQIEIVKIDLDNHEVFIADTTFEIYNSKNEIIDTITTDENGKAITKLLPIDDEYTVKESISNELYVLTEDTQKVVLEENQISGITFENEKKKGQIQVIKVDSENKEYRISDTTFEVYNSKGELVDTIITDSEGKATTKRLPIDDEYMVKETISNKAYVLSDEVQTVTLEENEIKNITFENTKKYGKIKINKVSSKYSKVLDLPANSPLANTKFLVVNENGENIGIYTTDETGSVLTDKLPYGEYTVYEYETPEHFLKDAAPQKIQITEDNQVFEITFKNAPAPELPKTGF